MTQILLYAGFQYDNDKVCRSLCNVYYCPFCGKKIFQYSSYQDNRQYYKDIQHSCKYYDRLVELYTQTKKLTDEYNSVIYEIKKQIDSINKNKNFIKKDDTVYKLKKHADVKGV